MKIYPCGNYVIKLATVNVAMLIFFAYLLLITAATHYETHRKNNIYSNHNSKTFFDVFFLGRNNYWKATFPKPS